MISQPTVASRDLAENQLALSPTAAARLMGVGRTFLYELIATGALKSVKLGKRRLITRSAIEACLHAHEEGTPSQASSDDSGKP